jgi:long-chain fatty acid transport protein
MEENLNMSSLKKNMKSGVAALAAMGAVAAVSVSAAQAGGFALREQSAIGQGTSFAGVAAGGSLSSIFWNPATLTQTKGISTESVFSGVIPSSDVDMISSFSLAQIGGATDNPGSVGLSALIPSSYAGVQLTDSLYFGLSVNAPFGMSTSAKYNSVTSFHAATSEIFTTDIKAHIAYRINDVFSVGAAIGVAYGDVRMTSLPGGNRYSLTGDDWTPTFALGATITPMEGTTIGIGYRSQTRLNLEGKENINGAFISPISAKLNLPDILTVGLRQKVTEKLTVTAGFEWAGWSSVKDPIAINGALTPGTALTLGYEDSWYASIGAEYDYNDYLTVRAGVGYEKSPIPDAFRNLRLPDANRVWASVGGSYNVSDKLAIDVGYSHLFIEDARVQVAGAENYSADTSSSADIISASMRYQWKPEPLFANDEPIVRKY